MKKQLQKKISAFIVLMMFSFIVANAQIVYTDVNPDVVSTGTYNLDLNNDGIIDFAIFHSTQTVTLLGCGTKTQNYIKISPSSDNQVIDFSSGNTYKLALNAGIDSNRQWSN